jgi:hypothetical protein
MGIGCFHREGKRKGARMFLLLTEKAWSKFRLVPGARQLFKCLPPQARPRLVVVPIPLLVVVVNPSVVSRTNSIPFTRFGVIVTYTL